MIKAHIAALTLAALAAAAQAQTPSTPYAGQESRTIKSLSDTEIESLLAGQGAGLAKAAELNGYPGPAHVLELAGELHLDDGQMAATRALLAAHKARARELGAELVAAERTLDRLFADKSAHAAAIDDATRRIGALQAQLRAEHLKTHMSQTRLLGPQQVQRYAALRGYTSAPAAVQTDDQHRPHQH